MGLAAWNNGYMTTASGNISEWWWVEEGCNQSGVSITDWEPKEMCGRNKGNNLKWNYIQHNKNMLINGTFLEQVYTRI